MLSLVPLDDDGDLEQDASENLSMGGLPCQRAYANRHGHLCDGLLSVQAFRAWACPIPRHGVGSGTRGSI